MNYILEICTLHCIQISPQWENVGMSSYVPPFLKHRNDDTTLFRSQSIAMIGLPKRHKHESGVLQILKTHAAHVIICFVLPSQILTSRKACEHRVNSLMRNEAFSLWTREQEAIFWFRASKTSKLFISENQ